MNVSAYTANGMPVGTMPSMLVSISNTNKVKRGLYNKQRKKRVNYNPREISSAILRASKSQSAGRIAVQAKGKLSNLLKCKGTGQYNENELNTAILHAKRMVRCAQLKTRNLRQEEQSKKRFEKEAKEELSREKNEIKAKAARKERNLEQKANLERMQRVQKQKSQKRELMRKKKFHRSHERGKLNEADMDYLRQQLRDLREPYSADSTMSGVTLELSTQAMQLTEVQIEQQIEQQIAAEMNSAGGSVGMVDSGTGSTMMFAGSGGSVQSAAGNFNVVI